MIATEGDNQQTIKLGYSDAEVYFETDADMLEFLKSLDEDEIENFVLEVDLDHDNKYAAWRVGHHQRTTEHLSQLGNGINNTTDTDDDYDGAIRVLRQLGEDIRGG